MTPKLKAKASGIWFWEFDDIDTGSRRRVSTNTRDKVKAQAMGRDIILGLDPRSSPAIKAPKAAGQFTMRALLRHAEQTIWSASEVKSQATLRSNIKILDDLIGDVAVVDMNTARLFDLKTALEQKGYAPGTVKRKMEVVSRALRLATDWGPNGVPLLASKPKMPTIKVSNLKDRIIEPDEEVAIFEAIEARRLKEPSRQWWRFARLVRWLLDTGMRLGEALQAGPANISHATVLDATGEPQLIPFVALERYQTKNDKPRTIPLSDRLAAELPALASQSGQGARGREVYFPMTSNLAWNMWDQIREDLLERGVDITDATLHTLRHTCGTRLARGGMDVVRLRDWLGHSDIKITADRYLHLVPTDLVKGLDILRANPTPPLSSAPNRANPAKALGAPGAAIRGESSTLRQ